VCAPMVEQSELAFRMLTRRYGCTLAYTPMLHARLFGEQAKYRQTMFTTCEEDRPVVAQFCGNEPQTVLEAAQYVQDQVDAVDLNCGCPQGIAKKGNYGAYLLGQGDLLTEICRTLVKGLRCNVTFKIRKVSHELQDTMKLIYSLEAAGCSLITVHGRTKEEKGQMCKAPDWETIRNIKAAARIPIALNGGIETWDDVQKAFQETHVDAVMSSEGLLENPTLFSGPVKPKKQDEVAKEYLECVRLYDAELKQVKKHLFTFLYAGLQFHTDLRSQLGQARDVASMEAIADELATRRRNEGHMHPDRPDAGWYRRHRNPIRGPDDKKNSAVAKTLAGENSVEKESAEAVATAQ